MRVLTELDLRHKYRGQMPKEIAVSNHTLITPSARHYLKETGTELIIQHETGDRRPEPGSAGIVCKCPDILKKIGDIRLAVSGRHVHLSQKDVEVLFGEGYRLTKKGELSQFGQFSAEETVVLVGPKGIIIGARVLGPERSQTQVEISRTDGHRLGIIPPERDSGDLAGTPGITLIGPRGTVDLEEGVITALRHIHMTSEDAKRMGLKDHDKVQVRVAGPRSLVYDEVLVRVRDDFNLEMHLDTDEANAASLATGTAGTIWISGEDSDV